MSLNITRRLTLIGSISGLGSGHSDEYNEILRKLRLLGIPPSGNYQIDKAKLDQAIKEKLENEQQKEQFKIEIQDKINPEERLNREKLEQERPGAQALGELKKILLGL